MGVGLAVGPACAAPDTTAAPPLVSTLIALLLSATRVGPPEFATTTCASPMLTILRAPTASPVPDRAETGSTRVGTGVGQPKSPGTSCTDDRPPVVGVPQSAPLSGPSGSCPPALPLLPVLPLLVPLPFQ